MDLIVRAIATVLDIVLTAYFWIVIISALLSWVNPDPYNPIVRFLRGVTEPVFYKIRRWIPFAVVGGIDLSPLVVILAIKVCQIVVVGNLMRLAYSIGSGIPM
ncbi:MULTISPECIES: YggT family protein [unclassified Pseudodesulfovibrio]|uniref:YggT family protein n=1 Tax=unclassified Pseudodesulfovibrio TaxID=2661612 RepID=UPI000FEC0B61|nr:MULTISPECIES: YggT family protein [unclassified Pseudodesulfovibrio]MCJ2163702.1 YggT family protein [Pseudodesulfovibrio sp. S3-i]RWU06043.1 YggT family protein [Pseudodesulfovibrio sp. S3]